MMFEGAVGYLCGGIGTLAVFVLLFRPWLTVTGWDGRAQTNAFGEIRATTRYLNLWSRSGGPALAKVSGVWGLFAVVSGVLVVFTVLLVLRGDRGRGHLVVGSTAVVAVSVVGDVFYLLSKGPDLKAMVGFSGDLGSHVGLLAYAISGRGRYPMPGTVDSYGTASLTTWAFLACVISILSAAAVLAQWNHNRRNSSSSAAPSSGR